MISSLEKEVQQLYGMHEELFSLFAKISTLEQRGDFLIYYLVMYYNF